MAVAPDSLATTSRKAWLKAVVKKLRQVPRWVFDEDKKKLKKKPSKPFSIWERRRQLDKRRKALEAQLRRVLGKTSVKK